MKRIVYVLISILLPTVITAQQLRPAGSVQIYHELHQLNKLTNVLYLAAHPDDENTRMIGWLVNEMHVPTAYLSLTRGDGGQNILGPHLGPALGLIRTHELLAARELDGGAGQFFTRAVDFGYSKTAEETFKHWDEDQLTSDATYVIRKFKPDVIICRFPPNKYAGHGQHAASAIIARKAYKAAGDQDKYKEQFQYVEPWQPKRILFNAYSFGSRNTTREDQFQQEVGQYNPLLGMGYGELAGISRSIHRSQGAGTRSVPGIRTEYLEHIFGDSIQNSLFDGIDITWGRIGRKDISEQIEKIISDYDFNHPERSLPSLLTLYKEVKQVKDNDWKIQKLKELEQLILHTSGFMAEIYTNKPEVIRGETVPLTMNFITRSGDVKVKLLDVHCIETDTSCQLFLPNDRLVSFERSITIPKKANYTEPYWLSVPQTDHAHYPIPKYEYLGQPKTPNELTAQMRVMIGDQTILIDVPISYKTLDATHGDVVEQLRVVPDVVINFTSGMLIMNDDGSVVTPVHIHTEVDLHHARLHVANENMEHSVGDIVLSANSDTTINVVVPVEKTKALGDNFYLFANIINGNNNYAKAKHTIKYEHLPTLQYYTAAYTKVLRKTWECAAKRIGYIDGAGDNVSEILNFAGLNVEVIEEKGITPANLKKYDAIMLGIRAINIKEQAPVWMPILLQYAKNGGTFIVQYTTAHRMKTKDIGPYPLQLSRDRVTEEDAEMILLQPEHKLMTYPNKLNKTDFDNWVQERGLYFANEWDKQYTPLFSMHDTGEEPLNGGTLYAPYGKGHYIFTPISFFRQLPAGNTGALRLLCNFLSVGK